MKDSLNRFSINPTKKYLSHFYIKMTCALDGLNNLKLTYAGDLNY